MTLTNRLGRPMLAAMFVTGGADQLIHPDEKADAAGPIVDEIDDKIDAVPMPSENRDAVRINGAVQLVAGGLLAMNRVPRLAATALAASLVPTTLAGHRFWEIDDEQARAQQRIHFMKNVAMLGGLVITIGDTGREPSMGWKARRAARKTTADIADTADDVRSSARRFRRSGADAATTVADSIGDLASSATEALPTASAGGPSFSAPDISTPDLSGVADDARDAARGLREAAAPAREALRDRASDLVSKAKDIDVKRQRKSLEKQAKQTRKQARKQARRLSDRAADLGRSVTDKVPAVSLTR